MTTRATDPFALLGLDPGADAAAVARAWRAQAAQHHPDAGGDPERFRQLVAARDELLDLRDGSPVGRSSTRVSVVRRVGLPTLLVRPLRRRIDRRLNPRVH